MTLLSTVSRHLPPTVHLQRLANRIVANISGNARAPVPFNGLHLRLENDTDNISHLGGLEVRLLGLYGSGWGVCLSHESAFRTSDRRMSRTVTALLRRTLFLTRVQTTAVMVPRISVARMLTFCCQ